MGLLPEFFITRDTAGDFRCQAKGGVSQWQGTFLGRRKRGRGREAEKKEKHDN